MALKENGTYFIYTVQPGDTLYSIAGMLGGKVEDITQMNALYPPFTDPGLVYAGQQIIVFYPFNPRRQVVYFVQPGDMLYRIAQRFGLTVRELKSMNPHIQDMNTLSVFDMLELPLGVYMMEPGDSIAAISQKLGVSQNAFVQLNHGRAHFSPDVLYPGYALLSPAPHN
ncbi:LysM domain-containing protein [Alteribacillus persepolensis]|uniref:LysM domain-containing protein n=1 Tax=Alteribacillus persepolensis TaxID=568899 RepID=A0A1G8IR54_9BACI|nr:LysM peptidoglycan-binding domain-containing protein [Alteribacillus persepolensis]SDI21478.1 LysM domain-containing protein [Alteribacillus persepolensis]